MRRRGNEAGDVAGREEQDAPGKRVADAVVMDREKLAATHSAVRHRLVMRAFADIGLEKDISEERLKAADAIIGRSRLRRRWSFRGATGWKWPEVSSHSRRGDDETER